MNTSNTQSGVTVFHTRTPTGCCPRDYKRVSVLIGAASVIINRPSGQINHNTGRPQVSLRGLSSKKLAGPLSTVKVIYTTGVSVCSATVTVTADKFRG